MGPESASGLLKGPAEGVSGRGQPDDREVAVVDPDRQAWDPGDAEAEAAQVNEAADREGKPETDKAQPSGGGRTQPVGARPHPAHPRKPGRPPPDIKGSIPQDVRVKAEINGGTGQQPVGWHGNLLTG